MFAKKVPSNLREIAAKRSQQITLYEPWLSDDLIMQIPEWPDRLHATDEKGVRVSLAAYF